MTKPFVHLHVHTTFSLLDGVSFRKDIIQRAKEYSQPAVAVTDHGSLYNHVSFYKQCVEASIKPILGIEAYIAPDSRHNRKYDAKKDLEVGDISAYAYHMILLAKNQQGYKNLMKLSTLSYREGFYRKPRIDLEILNEYKEGLIATSGCVGSMISQSIIGGKMDQAADYINKFRYMFGEDFYLELMAHEMPEDKVISDALIDFSTKLGIPTLLTNDSHFTDQSHAEAQEVALCLNGKKTILDPDHWKFQGTGYWFKSSDEMYELAATVGYPEESCTNSAAIASKIEDYSFRLAKTHGHMVPLFRDSSGQQWTAEQSHQKLVMSCWDGMTKRGLLGKPEYEARLTHELDVIERKNFSSYFLIIAGEIEFIEKHPGMIKPFGRGSSVGSLVCYALGITGMDPIRWNIPFYRFINEGRKDLPDIDTDISQRHRKSVLHHIVQQYGEENVAQIATFQTLAAKAALDNVGRAMGVPSAVRRALSQLIGDTVKGDTITELLEGNDEAHRIMETTPGWLENCKILEGGHRNISQHAAGVVICNEAIDNYVPLARDVDGFRVTQFDMIDIQDLGLLKLDMLGLKALDTIYDTMKMVERKYNIKLDVHNLPVDDADTYALIFGGEFVSVFQYDSTGMRQMAKQLRPDKFELLMALNALYRPGPMEPQKKIDPNTGKEVDAPSIADVFLERRHGRQEFGVWHPSLAGVLADTFGMPLYQEQISEMSKIIAGFDDTEADEYRAAIGKKDPIKFKAAQAKFKDHGLKKGHSEEFMDFLVAQLTGFARYGWNRGHAAGYSYISYITAYLESHFPLQYYTALLNTNLDKSDKLMVLLAAIMQKGIQIKPPQINESGAYFSTDGDVIYMGLFSVRNLAEQALATILWQREVGGKYTSFIDFIKRTNTPSAIPTDHEIFIETIKPHWDYEKLPLVPSYFQLKAVNKTVIENLTRAGSFGWDDTFTDKDKVAVIESIQKQVKKKTVPEDFQIIGNVAELITGIEYSKMERSTMECEVLNFYVSGHPVATYTKLFKLLRAEGRLITPSQLAEQDLHSAVVIMGFLESRELKTTKNNKPYLVLRLQDQFGTVTCRVWSPLAEAIWPTLKENQMIMVRGTTEPDNFRKGETDIHVRNVVPMDGGIPTRGFITDSRSKIYPILAKIGNIDASTTEVPGYGIVTYLKQATIISPEILEPLLGQEGLVFSIQA